LVPAAWAGETTTLEVKLAVPIGDVGDFTITCTAGKDCPIDILAKYIVAVFRYGTVAAAILAAAMIMIAGFLWLTAGGRPNQISKAKDVISSSFLGLFLALFSTVILQTVNPDLINLKSVTPTGTGVTSAASTTVTATVTAETASADYAVSGPVAAGPGSNYDPMQILEAGLATELPTSGQYNNSNGGFTEIYNQIAIDRFGNAFVGGRATTFGGANDTGVSDTETGAVTGENLRSLDSDNDYYVAFRWDYSQTSADELRGSYAQVYNPDTGQYVNARIVDWGPGAQTGNSVDTSNAVMNALGAQSGSDLYIRLVISYGTSPGPVF
ncbi:MAG: septal ring lytic transglycosylase RlpA family protein, partial [Patescibacteria group bacterium]|nr:septal ring lytic transglycosylase RlpA family protein [Patescibacteria group bacterium]